MTRSSARQAPAADEAKTYTVYNSTDGPLPYDRAGRMVGARDSVEVKDPTVSPISGHVTAGRFVVLNPDDDAAEDETTPQLESADDGAQTQEA